MSAEFSPAAAAAMELGEVMGLQGFTVAVRPVPSPRESDMLKRAGFTQAAAAASYPSPFLDEQKMLRFSKAAHALPSGLNFGRPNEQAFLLSRTKRPFTPSQWMELEHQALIYKYLNAKAPIPSSLLISISKNFRSSNRVSWRPLYQGYINADSDPEPGRCRRTDGKKWRCSKEAMADHKYCERHINRNRHRSRKPVENQPRNTAKDAPAAGSLSCAVSQGSLKKAKVNDLKPGTVSYWTDSLNRTMLSREKANKPTEDNTAPLLNPTNHQPTLSLLSQPKQQNKPDKFSPTVDSESISSDTILKAWESSNQQSNKNISSTQLHDAECLQSVLQNFSLAKNEKMESEKNKYSDSVLVSSTFSPQEGQRLSCLASNMTPVQEDCISSSWEMPQGGPLGEILTNSKNYEDSTKKRESRSYGWLLNLDHAT
ncbi:growth-regulating factor 9-like [Phragmites australis]|uniref:growth-regulating factor 9-like n=1 Tax=Phragmites australis TaxID=29695 RepID=UPI002D77CD3C|nr:growth-regulating factor 9-like [Phragmites australis]